MFEENRMRYVLYLLVHTLSYPQIVYICISYRIAGVFGGRGKVGESSAICRTKTIQITFWPSRTVHSPNFSSPKSSCNRFRQTLLATAKFSCYTVYIYSYTHLAYQMHFQVQKLALIQLCLRPSYQYTNVPTLFS